MVWFKSMPYNRRALEEDKMITVSYLVLKIEKKKATLENQRIEKIYEIDLKYLPSECKVGDYLELHDNVRMVINKRKRMVREDFLALLGEEE